MKITKEYRNSDVGAVRQFQALSKTISPARSLNESEMVYFEAIISSRAFDTWNAYDIIQATDMAAIMHARDQHQEQLSAEGVVVTNSAGNLVKHPLNGIVFMESQQIMSLTKSLGLTAPQRGLNTPEAKNKNKVDAKAREAVKAGAGHDLLASADED